MQGLGNPGSLAVIVMTGRVAFRWNSRYTHLSTLPSTPCTFFHILSVTMSESGSTMFSMLSEKGFKLVVLDGFKFSKSRRTQCGQKWRCGKKGCSAHLFTDDDGDVLFKFVGEHNHEPCPNLHRQYISNSAKRKATETLSEPPAKVIRKEIQYAPEDISNRMTRIECVET